MYITNVLGDHFAKLAWANRLNSITCAQQGHGIGGCFIDSLLVALLVVYWGIYLTISGGLSDMSRLRHITPLRRQIGGHV